VREQVAAAEEVEARAARVAESRARWGSVQVSSRQDPFAALNGPATTRQQLVGAIVQANEGRDIDGDNQRHFERLLNRHSRQTGGREWALELLGRSRPEYESGFSKLMMGRAELLTPEERTAMSVGSNTNGGYLLPTHLDPTLILTNSGSSNMIRGLARVVTLTNGETTWHGVTTAGVTASWDGELAEVSDDTPTLGSVSIATNVAQAFVQGSIAAFQDINSLTSDVMMLFADARDRLEGAAHATGLGSSNQPKGIFTACNASTASRSPPPPVPPSARSTSTRCTGPSRCAGARTGCLADQPALQPGCEAARHGLVLVLLGRPDPGSGRQVAEQARLRVGRRADHADDHRARQRDPLRRLLELRDRRQARRHVGRVHPAPVQHQRTTCPTAGAATSRTGGRVPTRPTWRRSGCWSTRPPRKHDTAPTEGPGPLAGPPRPSARSRRA
jgi:hypothetical protein